MYVSRALTRKEAGRPSIPRAPTRPLGSSWAAELVGRRSWGARAATATMLAAAQALHLMPMDVGIPPASLMGPASGSFGVSREQFKLLAESDSDSDAELEALCSAAPPAVAAPPPLQQEKDRLEQRAHEHAEEMSCAKTLHPPGLKRCCLWLRTTHYLTWETKCGQKQETHMPPILLLFG